MPLTQKEVDLTYSHFSPILMPNSRSDTLSMHRTHWPARESADMELHMQTHCGTDCAIDGLYL